VEQVALEDSLLVLTDHVESSYGEIGDDVNGSMKENKKLLKCLELECDQMFTSIENLSDHGKKKQGHP